MQCQSFGVVVLSFGFVKGKEWGDDTQIKHKEVCRELSYVRVDYEPSAVKGERSKSLLFVISGHRKKDGLVALMEPLFGQC